MKRMLSTKRTWHLGVLIIRVFTAFFIYRYSRELFNIGDLLKFLAEVKWPFPVFSGYAAKIIELVGSILLALGLLTRIAAPLLMIVMAGVIFTMGGGDIFNSEGASLFFMLFALFMFIGPGKFSLDYYLFDRKAEATGSVTGSRAINL